MTFEHYIMQPTTVTQFPDIFICCVLLCIGISISRVGKQPQEGHETHQSVQGSETSCYKVQLTRKIETSNATQANEDAISVCNTKKQIRNNPA